MRCARDRARSAALRAKEGLARRRGSLPDCVEGRNPRACRGPRQSAMAEINNRVHLDFSISGRSSRSSSSYADVWASRVNSAVNNIPDVEHGDGDRDPYRALRDTVEREVSTASRSRCRRPADHLLSTATRAGQSSHFNQRTWRRRRTDQEALAAVAHCDRDAEPSAAHDPRRSRSADALSSTRRTTPRSRPGEDVIAYRFRSIPACHGQWAWLRRELACCSRRRLSRYNVSVTKSSARARRTRRPVGA